MLKNEPIFPDRQMRIGGRVRDGTGRAAAPSPRGGHRTPRRRRALPAVGLRLLAGGMFVCAGLGLLLTELPRGEAKSYASAPASRDSFADRWPDFTGATDNVSADALRVRTVAVSAPIEPKTSLRSMLVGGLASANQNWNADVLPHPLPKPDDAALRINTAHNLQASHDVQLRSGLPSTNALAAAKTELVKFATAPFPYEGVVPTTDEPFLNVVDGGQKGHRSWNGRVLWQDQTFKDNRVLLHIPAGFDIDKPAVMVVFFHGHRAELTRDVLQRQQVPEQISMSGVNAVLVAPQFAFNAADSSPGRFWQPGAFGRFVGEAGKKLARLYGDPEKAKPFENMPVVIVAYSGGYLPAAWSIQNGGLGKRLHGVVLLDALYAKLDVFAHWIETSKSGFFVSAYTGSTRRHNLEFARLLDKEKIPFSTTLGDHLWRGRVALIETDGDIKHRDFVTRAWTDDPIRDVLAKLN
jgi:hypothetical protein